VGGWEADREREARREGWREVDRERDLPASSQPESS